jgi:hypothetical protein
MLKTDFNRSAAQTTDFIACYIASKIGGHFKKRSRNVYVDLRGGHSFLVSSSSLGKADCYWFDIYDDRLCELLQGGSVIFGFADRETFFWLHKPFAQPAFNSITTRQRPDGRVYRQVFFTSDLSGNLRARHAPLNAILIQDSLPATTNGR